MIKNLRLIVTLLLEYQQKIYYYKTIFLIYCRYVAKETFCIIILGLLLLALFTGLLYSQLSQLISGKTRQELKKGIPLKMKTNLYRNMTQLLGRRWLLVWVCPFISSSTEQHPD